ncbi:MAG: hypothetical protein WDZ59_07695 [Pirellulales bacterium]
MTEHKKWENEMSSEFSAMMDGFRSEPMPEDSLQRSLQAAEAIVMTKTAHRRGMVNAAIVAAVMYTLVGAVSLAISKLFHISMIFAVGGTFGVVWAVTFSAFLVSMLMGRTRAGYLLLDCGPHPSRKMFLTMSVFLCMSAICSLVASTDAFAILISLFLFTFASFFMITSTGRLRFCENGVWQYWSLLRWSKIESYRWEGTTDATLMLQAKTWFAFMGRGSLPVAIEQKDDVDALMQQHVG